MNAIARFLRKLRMKSFPGLLAARLAQVTPEETATALVEAVNYCVNLGRDFPAEGTAIATALIDPRKRASAEIENLYFNLEDLFNAASHSAVSKPSTTLSSRGMEQSSQSAMRIRPKPIPLTTPLVSGS